jgi:hypothetical protein
MRADRTVNVNVEAEVAVLLRVRLAKHPLDPRRGRSEIGSARTPPTAVTVSYPATSRLLRVVITLCWGPHVGERVSPTQGLAARALASHVIGTQGSV